MRANFITNIFQVVFSNSDTWSPLDSQSRVQIKYN